LFCLFFFWPLFCLSFFCPLFCLFFFKKNRQIMAK
jgi:hypothetical protein